MKFFNLLNSLQPSIKFTLDKSWTRLPFLNILLTKMESFKQTFIISLPIQKVAFIHISIPYNLARRLKMIISEDNTLLVRLERLKTFLLQQKYPPSLIDDSIAKNQSFKEI